MHYLFTHVTAVGSCPEEDLQDGFLAVDQGKITYIGTQRPEGSFQREISCQGKILTAGLVNAHTHLPMTLLRGIGGGNNLQDWLHNHIFPAEARLDSRAVKAGTRLAIGELLACGVTSVADMYNFCDDIAQVVAESGINANLSRGVLSFDPSAKPEELEGVQETISLIDQWHNYNQGQIKVDLSIHGEYTSNASVWDHMAKIGAERNLPIHIHVSETRSEHEEAKERHGKTALQALGEHGLWNRGGLAAHCVWTEESDWDYMVEKGISPVHNPVSNLKLGSGVAPVGKMLEKGVNVALGTDSVASNNNHDLWEEIKLSAILHNGLAENPTLISSRQAWNMATKQGGIALGRKTGVLAVGYDADLILVDVSGISMTPCHDPVENLVFSARGTDVCFTMCQGRIVYENGQFPTLDMDAVKKEVQEYAIPCILG